MNRGARTKPFLLVRDDFYRDPDAVRARAQAMAYAIPEGITGYSSNRVHHEPGIRRRIERILGARITRWDTDPDDGNGIFYMGLSRGARKETPGVHTDEPADDVTIVVYLTPGLPAAYGTSLWRHKATGLIFEPDRADARRLGTTLRKLRERLERDSERRARWEEIDRAGYKYNRMVAYPSGMLHSATRHYGGSLGEGRIYQTFRVGVDARRCGLFK
ncbi:MAG TPA: DUF6445 family protein [Rhizomicrobium sp.]|jgi:hypothetical protein|nr:DUF6445 family protein [Rhizomicrobium sp.]